jgi:hypothetical protein
MGSYLLGKASLVTLHKIRINNDGDTFLTLAVKRCKSLSITNVLQVSKCLSMNKYLLLLKKHSKAHSIAWLGRDC